LYSKYCCWNEVIYPEGASALAQGSVLVLLVRVLFPCIVRWHSNSVNITNLST
jgi:hypothetical protein